MTQLIKLFDYGFNNYFIYIELTLRFINGLLWQKMIFTRCENYKGDGCAHDVKGNFIFNHR